VQVYECWDPSVSLSFTLSKNEKVEHHIRIETHKSIAYVLIPYVLIGLMSY